MYVCMYVCMYVDCIVMKLIYYDILSLIKNQ